MKICILCIILFSKSILCRISASSSCNSFPIQLSYQRKILGERMCCLKGGKESKITLRRTIFTWSFFNVRDRLGQLHYNHLANIWFGKQKEKSPNYNYCLCSLFYLLFTVIPRAKYLGWQPIGLPRVALRKTGIHYSAQCPDHRVHTEWQLPLSSIHSIMMEKFAQPGEGGDVRRAPFTISTITYKVVVYAPAERAGTLRSHYFYSTPICTLLTKLVIRVSKCIFVQYKRLLV